MSPGIEIWDLDVLDAVEPVAVLGGEAPAAPVADSQPSKGKAKKVRAGAWPPPVCCRPPVANDGA